MEESRWRKARVQENKRRNTEKHIKGKGKKKKVGKEGGGGKERKQGVKIVNKERKKNRDGRCIS